MKTNSSVYSRYKWVFWAGGIVAVVILAAFLFSAFFFQPWLKKRLVREVEEKSGGLYRLEMDAFSASLPGGTLTIDGLRLLPSYERWEQQKKEEQADLSPVLAEVQAAKLRLSGISYLGLLRNRPLRLSAVKVKQPVVQLTRMMEDTTAAEPLHRRLSGPLQDLRIGKVEIEDGNISFKKSHSHRYNAYELKGLNLELQDLRLDSAAYEDKERIFYARSADAEATHADLLLHEGNYRIKTGKATVSGKAGEVSLQRVRLVPLYKPDELARRVGEATTWVSASIPGIRLTGVDFPLFSRHGNIAVSTITVQNAQVKCYKDKKNFPEHSEDPLPHDLVQRLKTGLYIRKINIRNMNIRYDELAKKANETGHITFDNLNATITNVTNDKNRISAEKPAVCDLNLKLMQKVPLQASIRLALLDPGCYHTLRGTIGQGEMQVLNSLIEASDFVSFRSGTVKEGKFNVELYRNTATGTMLVQYHDFKLDVLSNDEDKRQSLGSKIKSKIANKVVVKADNPSDGEELREGEIKVTRRKHRSVFTYWGDCLESGLLSSTGLAGFKQQ